MVITAGASRVRPVCARGVRAAPKENPQYDRGGPADGRPRSGHVAGGIGGSAACDACVGAHGRNLGQGSLFALTTLGVELDLLGLPVPIGRPGQHQASGAVVGGGRTGR